MRKHITHADALVSGWDNGKPVTTLCGITRKFDESGHNDRLSLPTCRSCERIASKASAVPVVAKTVSEIRGLFTTATWTYEGRILSVQKWQG